MKEILENSPFDENEPLSLEQAGERFLEIKNTYHTIARKYSGPIGIFRTTIDGQDLTALVEAMGKLLPLSMQESVQNEMLNADDVADTLFVRLANLQEKILSFSATFKNSGVRVVRD